MLIKLTASWGLMLSLLTFTLLLATNKLLLDADEEFVALLLAWFPQPANNRPIPVTINNPIFLFTLILP